VHRKKTPISASAVPLPLEHDGERRNGVAKFDVEIDGPKSLERRMGRGKTGVKEISPLPSTSRCLATKIKTTTMRKNDIAAQKAIRAS
jgi:hypothetical protein